MVLTKTIPIGDIGALVIKEEAGVASVQFDIKAGAGGGDFKDVVKVTNSTKVEFGAEQLADIGLDALSMKFPSIKPIVDLLKAEMAAVLK